MKRNRNNISIIFGILLICGFISGLFSSVPILETSHYLADLANMKININVSALFQLLMAISYTLIAVILYPVLCKYNKSIAVGYLSFRLIGSLILYIGVLSLLLLFKVSETYSSINDQSATSIVHIAEFIRLSRDWLNHVVMFFPWCIGGLFLYYALFRMKIIPLYLSIWGFAGTCLTLLSTFLIMFDVIKIVNPVYFLLNLTAALFEIYLSIFMFAKGFYFN